jgi:hypothetical protein
MPTGNCISTCCFMWVQNLRFIQIRVFEKRMNCRIFGSQRNKVKGDLRKLCNQEFHTLHSSLNIIMMTKWRWNEQGTYHGWGRWEMLIKFWFQRLKGKGLFGYFWCSWEDNIKIDVWGMGRLVWVGFMWLRSRTSGTLVNTVGNLLFA